MIQQPNNSEKCSACSHSFGEHFSTYGGQATGCSHYDDFQRDGGPCACKGFAMIWRPTMHQEVGRS